MADVREGIAEYLQSLGLVTYDTATPNGDCYIEAVPQRPDACVVISAYPGTQPDSKLGYDEPRLQVRVRGKANDVSGPYTRLVGIYNALHGLQYRTLPDGTYLVDCIALASGPEPLGEDGNNRPEYVLNFQLEVRNTAGGRQ